MSECTIRRLQTKNERYKDVKRFRINRLTIPELSVVVEFASEEEFLRFINLVEEKTIFESSNALFYFVSSDSVFCAKKRG